LNNVRLISYPTEEANISIYIQTEKRKAGQEKRITEKEETTT